MLQNMITWFDASDDHAKELRRNLAYIGQKVDAHAISIKDLELQIAQLSSIVNPRKQDTFPSNSIQNPKNDSYCMKVTTRGVRKLFIHLSHLA